MDSRLRGLWRRYRETHDGAVAASLWRALLASAAPLEEVVALRDDISEDNVELLREISKYLYRKGIPYPTPQNWQTRRFDYRNPPEEASNWVLVEFNQTEFWNQEIQDQVVAITGVYLVDLTPVHIAEITPSVAMYPMYANVIHVVPTSDLEFLSPEYDARIDLDEMIESEWGLSEELVSYLGYGSLKGAIEWVWVPEEVVAQHFDDYEEPDEQIQSLREYYLGNRAI